HQPAGKAEAARHRVVVDRVVRLPRGVEGLDLKGAEGGAAHRASGQVPLTKPLASMQLLKARAAAPAADRLSDPVSMPKVLLRCQLPPRVAVMSSLIPICVESAALACAWQACTSRAVVASSLPVLVQRVVVTGAAQTVSNRQPRTAPAARGRRPISVPGRRAIIGGSVTIASSARSGRRAWS